jgi:hypothetical protein
MIRFIGHFDTAKAYTLQSTITHTHILVSTVTSSLSLLGSGFQRRPLPFLWVTELSPTSATSFSQQQITTTKPQRLSNSLKVESHIATDGQSISKSWCRPPQIFITHRQLWSCVCGAPFLSLSLMLRPTVSRPNYGPTFVGVLSGERTGLSFV